MCLVHRPVQDPSVLEDLVALAVAVVAVKPGQFVMMVQEMVELVAVAVARVV